MRVLCSTLILFVFAINQTHAQTQNGVWHLNNGVRLDFTTSPATVTSGLPIMSPEGTATVTDANGEVLFVAAPGSIYDKNYQIIENGNDLLGDRGNSAQSPLVVQNPGDENQFYVFSIADHLDDIEGGFFYHIVEYCPNTGKLKVLEDKKNIQIPGQYSERLHAVRIESNNSYWILTTGLEAKTLYAFRLNSNGLSNNPVETARGGGDGRIGKIAVSPDKSRLAWSTTFNVHRGLSIYDFNENTGRISSEFKISQDEIYGLAWSSTGNNLFFTDVFLECSVNVFNRASNTITIIAQGDGNYAFGALAMEPYTNSILVTDLRNNSLSRISDPDNTATYDAGYIDLQGNMVDLGLQNQCIHFRQSFPINSLSLGEDVSICDSTYTINAGQEVLWSTGEFGESITVNTSGTYIAMIEDSCGTLSDTIEVELIQQVAINLEPVYELCEGESINLNIDGPFTSIQWSTGNTSDNETFDIEGNYSVRVVNEGCSADSFTFEIVVIDEVIREETIPLCGGEPVVINGITYTTIGTYSQNFTSVNGCDSTFIINVITDPDCNECNTTREVSRLQVKRNDKKQFSVILESLDEKVSLRNLTEEEVLSTVYIYSALCQGIEDKGNLLDQLKNLDTFSRNKLSLNDLGKDIHRGLVRDIRLMNVNTSFSIER